MPITRLTSRAGDRRRARRLRTWLRVDYCPLVRDSRGLKVGTPQRAIASDLSASGLFITEASYLPVGAVVHLFIRLPDVAANPIVCFGKVVRATRGGGGGFGVRFMRLRTEDARRLESYTRSMESHRSQQLSPDRTLELTEQDLEETTGQPPLAPQRTEELGEQDLEELKPID